MREGGAPTPFAPNSNGHGVHNLVAWRKVKKLSDEFFRFVVIGILNLLLSLVLYQVLMFIVSANLAYAITWVLGILLVSTVYPALVFSGAQRDSRNSIITIGIYVFSFILGSAVIALAEHFFPGNRFSILMALALTTSFNFLSMRLLLLREKERLKS